MLLVENMPKTNERKILRTVATAALVCVGV